MKFPVFSLMIREFDGGAQFASDCIIRHSVRDFRFSAEKSKILPMLAHFLLAEGPGEV
jgi:hypothetical protein